MVGIGISARRGYRNPYSALASSYRWDAAAGLIAWFTLLVMLQAPAFAGEYRIGHCLHGCPQGASPERTSQPTGSPIKYLPVPSVLLPVFPGSRSQIIMLQKHSARPISPALKMPNFNVRSLWHWLILLEHPTGMM